MPDAPNVPQPEIVHRSVRLRLLPGSRAAAQQLAGTVGACRFVWNYFLARQSHAYPTFKRKHARQDGFTLPDKVQVRDHQLRVPRIGWLRLKGSNLYAQGQPVQARIRQEGTRARPKWYAYLTYAVPAGSVRAGAATGVLGLDRNVGQVTDSDGDLYPMTDMSRLDSKIARKQRLRARKRKGSVRARRLGGQLTKLRRKQKRVRDNDTHHISRALADKAHTLVAEALNTKGMTKSARGTKDHPGTHVTAKSGLNRSILASNWGQLAQRQRYKCGRFETVDLRHTSQTCHQCGHVAAANRKTQAVFHCQRCAWQLHADHNAALNILVRFTRTVARGTGATARREAFPLGTSTTREHDVLESVYSST